MVVLFARESKFKVVIQTVVCCWVVVSCYTLLSLSTVEESCLWSTEIFLPLEGGPPDEEEAHEEGSA